MGNSVRFQMNIDTVSKIVRNFPQLANKKLAEFSEIDVKMIMMIDQPELIMNMLF
jgi:hypothetical protein